MATDPISYDKQELRGIIKAFKAMDEAAVEAAKKESSALAEYASAPIQVATLTSCRKDKWHPYHLLQVYEKVYEMILMYLAYLTAEQKLMYFQISFCKYNRLA